VHWQPQDDPRPESVKVIDEEGAHIYEWDAHLTFDNDRAQMELVVKAQSTSNRFGGILEKHF
jgi:hypothetical protein